MSSESQQKEMDALIVGSPVKVGDEVEVEVRERLAWKAVLLAYILPFVVMLGIIAGLDLATDWSEAVVGTLSLCGIAVYYIGLSFFKGRLQKQFVFTARFRRSIHPAFEIKGTSVTRKIVTFRHCHFIG